MAGWIRNRLFLIWIALASEAAVSQAIAQDDSPAATAPSPRERKLEYALRIAKAQSAFTHNYVAQARQLLESCPPDLRRWEWHYLRRLCNSELKSMPVPKGTEEVLLSPDGSRYALVGRRKIAVRSLSGDKDVFELKGFVRDAAFSPDGRTLAVAEAGSVALVDVADGTTRKTIQVPILREQERIIAVCLDPGGDRLGLVRFYSENSNRKRVNELTIWDVGTGRPVKTFGELPTSTMQVRFSPDGKLVAARSSGAGAENPHWPGEVRIWDLETGQRIHKLQTYDPDELPDDTYFMTDFVFSHDGAHVIAGSNDGIVRVWEVGSGRKVHTLKAHKGRVASVAFDGIRNRIVTGGADRIIRVWDLATGAEINSMRGHTSSIKAVAFLDGLRVASVGQNIRIWDAASPQSARTYQGHHRGSIVYGVAFGPKSDLLGTASMHVARIRNVQRGRLRRYEEEVKTGSQQPGPGIAFSPDGRLFGTTDGGGGKLWNVETGELVHELPDGVKDFWGTMFCIAFDPTGSLVATSGKELAIWNQKTGELVRKIKMDRKGCYCVAFTPDGKQVITGHDGYRGKEKDTPGEVHFRDVDTGSLKRKITAEGTGRMWFSLNADAQRIAVTTDDRVTVYDTSNGTKLLQLRGHSRKVNGVAFSPDGDRIASGSDDHTVRIWDANSGQELLSLHGQDAPVVRVAFSPNGLHLASSSQDLVKVWDAIPPGELRVQIQDRDETEPPPIPRFPAVTSPAEPDEDEQRPKIVATNVSEIAVIKKVELPEAWLPRLDLGPAPGEITVTEFRKPLKVLDAQEFRPTREVVAELHSVFFTASRDGKRVAWSDESRTVIETLADHRQVVIDSKNRYAHIAFSPAGKLLATGGQGSRARIWDAESGDLRFVLDTEARGSILPLFSPDGRLIAVQNYRSKTRIFDAATGDLVHLLPGEGTTTIAFRPDSRVLATTYFDEQIRLWDMSNGQLLKSAKASAGPPRTVEWDPTGSLLAFGGRGLEFRDAKTLEQLHAVPEVGFVSSVRFTSDGTRLLCTAVTRVGRERVAKALSLAVPTK